MRLTPNEILERELRALDARLHPAPDPQRIIKREATFMLCVVLVGLGLIGQALFLSPISAQIRLRFVGPAAQGGGGAENPIAAARLPGGSATLPNPSWSDDGVHIIGQAKGIPTGRSTCYTDTGGLDTVGTLNTAIAACTSGGVVQLQAGTYSFSSALVIGVNDVTVNGAGPLSTKITYTGFSQGCGDFRSKAIQMCATNNYGSANYGSPQHTATWSTGFTQGTSVITLSCGASCTNLEVGGVLFLDQLNDTVGNGVTTGGYPAAGDLIQCESSTPCTAEGGGTYQRAGRIHVEVHQVTAYSGSNITIAPPILSPDFRSGQTPGAWWGNLTGASRAIVQNSGIENLTVDFTGTCNTGSSGPADAGCQTGFYSANTLNTWIKNVRFIRTSQFNSFVMHIVPVQAFRFEVRDSYLYGPDSIVLNGSNGFPITNYTYAPHITGASLFENNIVHACITCITNSDMQVGDVTAYNYVDGGYGTYGTQLHGAGGDMLNLHEGNDYGQIYSDNNHGNHYFYTMFRNYINKDVHNSNSASNGSGYVLLYHARFWNIVGNVNSAPGFTTYESANCTTASCSDSNVYITGWEGNCGACGPLVLDTHVSRTLFRWGNWDNVTSSADNTSNDQTGTRWCGNSSNTGWVARCGSATEVPLVATVPNYPNTIPSTETLPNSLYLSAKPSWFGASDAWPPIGPDIVAASPISNTGAHVNKIPARRCFESLANDAAYASSSPRVRNFDGGVCYP